MKFMPSRRSRRAASLLPLSREVLAHVRGGDSGPSDSNRIIERHELPGNQGAALPELQ